jgi:hypothetical protein
MDLCQDRAAQGPDKRPGAGREEKGGGPGSDRTGLGLLRAVEGCSATSPPAVAPGPAELHGPYWYFLLEQECKDKEQVCWEE